MQIPGHGRARQFFPILGAGLLAAVLSVGWATSAPRGPVAVAGAAHDSAAHDSAAHDSAAHDSAAHDRAAHDRALPDAPAPSSTADVVPTTTADRAVLLQALLGQHSVLASDLMRSRIRGDDDFVQAANAALGRNTDAMTALVGRLFGADAAKTFGPLWSEHVVSVVEYGGAVAGQDDEARTRAREKIVKYERELAAFFAGASGGRLPQDAALQAVGVHVEHLTGQADAYAARDYAAADRIYREGYQHAYDMGGTLAGALLPAGVGTTLRAPVWRLRSQLGKLLAEHAVLVEDVTRAAVTNTPDFDAAAAAVNENTRALVSAIDTLFGAPAARDFQALWADHVEQLVAYSAGAAAGDAARQERARTALRGFEQRMAAFLGTATGGRMSTGDLTAALLLHDQMLVRHADAYAAKDYATAHDIAYRTYEHMFELARHLADAFGSTVAARLPVGGAQTGHGGLADVVGR
jgi:hypothetical protein